MLVGISLFFASPWLFAAALIVAAIATWVARQRQVGLPRESWILAGAGLGALILAAGGFAVRVHRDGGLVVMVDLSPSARTAEFRNRGTLEARIKELVGKQRYRAIYFADGIANAPGNGASKLEDVPCEKTAFPQANGAEAVLLFSDGRFELPEMGPRVFAVVDPGLENVPDAAVKRLELRGNQIAAAVDNHGQAREFSLSSIGFTTRVATGKYWINREVKAQAGTTITAALKAGDAWPENDSLSVVLTSSAPAPGDPNLAVTWRNDEKLAVEVKAIENQKYLNGLALWLELFQSNPSTMPTVKRALEQIGPGRYRLEVTLPREPGFAILKLGENAVDRLAVAGRYAPEFEEPGNDRRAMEELAKRTGGRVIEPGEKGAIDFGMPARAFPPTSELSAIGAGLLAAAVGWWKLGLMPPASFPPLPR